MNFGLKNMIGTLFDLIQYHYCLLFLLIFFICGFYYLDSFP